LPDTIQFTAGHQNYYTYDASGKKLELQNITSRNILNLPQDTITCLTSSTKLTTDYCGDAIYQNDTLKEVLTPEGYWQNGLYYYYLKDHQGNNRVVINSSGVVQEYSDYYPDGMRFESSTSNSAALPYRYNGKELEAMNGLNEYDYGARRRETGIPIWTTMDPLAEKYYGVSPYVYALDNPMKFIDPDGRGVFPSAAELRSAGVSVVNNKEFLRNGKTTYCNFGSQAINSMSGDNSVRGRANDMGNYLRNSDNATPLTQQQALDYANQGVVVFASYVSDGKSGPGHIAVVAPTEELSYSPSRKENVVSVFNVGTTNGEVTLTQAFGIRDVGLFILNADLETVNNRTPTVDGGVLPEVVVTGQNNQTNQNNTNTPLLKVNPVVINLPSLNTNK
jgi:RHS repeat-associated protein